MKFRYILVTIGCLLNGIPADENFECRKIDFNKFSSVNLFEQCSIASDFTIKSYGDDPMVPAYDFDFEYYLSNTLEGWSCFSSLEHFTLEADTDFIVAIFLQSLIIDNSSQVEIEAIDLDNEDSVFPVINAIATTTYTWTPYSVKFGRNVANATISIRAFVTRDAKLAIQYLHILNPRIDESSCDIEEEITTEEITTEEITTEEITTEEITTEEITTEEITTEEITTEEITTEEITTEEITTEEITTEEITTEEITTEEITTEEITTEEITTEEITTEEITTEEITTEEITTEEITTEEITTEEITTEEITTEEITTEEITTEEITTEEVTTEEITTEEITTEEITTEEVTTPQTSTPSTTTPTQPDTNDSRVWIITSFVFLVTTVALMAGLIYLIYLYKTALALKTAMLSAAAITSAPTTIPRLTVATSSQGNQVIVGIEQMKQR